MSTHPSGNQPLEHLQQRLREAEPRAGIAMLVFCKNLFELNPALRPMLGEEPGGEDRFLEPLLAAGLGPLFRPKRTSHLPDANAGSDAPLPDEDHCSVVGEALLWTLEEAFGADFTPKVRSAWETLYRFITTSAKQGRTAIDLANFDDVIAAG